MNKKLILVLVIAVALVGTWAFAMHSKKAPATQEAAQKFTIEEMPGLPHSNAVPELTEAELQEMLSHKGLTKVDPELTKEKMISEAASVPDEQLEPEAMAATLCEIYPHEFATCCYYHPGGEDELWGWGQVWLTVWQDPQFDPIRSLCGYPIYPYAVDRIRFQIWAPAAGNYLIKMALYDFDWYYNTPYVHMPGIAYTDTFTFAHPGGFAYAIGYFDPPVCVYDRFFAGAAILNSNDFWLAAEDPPEEPPCLPGWPATNAVDSCILYIDTISFDCVEPTIVDEDSCLVSTEPDVYGHFENVVTDTTWGHIPPYRYPISLIFDQAAQCGRAYWNPFNETGHWYDAVCELPGYGMGWPGTFRIRARGTTAAACPDSVYWWQKESFFEYDEGTETVLAYAPCGVPDFDQKFKEAAHPQIDAPWDGPTALANCLWWMVAADKLDMFWTDIGVGDLWNPANPPIVINQLAEYMQFGDCGVGPDEFDAGLNALVEDKVLWVDIREMHQPTWEFIEYEARLCEDVILLLGFWYPEVIPGEPPETTWYRIGGHWVTVAGVAPMQGKLKISDPDLDWAEMTQGAYGEICSFSYYIPHVWPHVGDFVQHMDAGNTSHDIYAIAPSITPCGLLMIPDYPYYELILAKYLGHNKNPYCPGEVAQVLPPPEVPIFVEIEFAKAISPKTPWLTEQIDSWNVAMVKTNYGEEGPGYITWEDGGTDQLFEGTVILGTGADNLAMSLTNAGQEIRFFPYAGIETDYRYYEHMLIDTCYAKFFHNYGLDLDVEMFGIGLDPGGDFCIGQPCGDMILQKFVITNTGDAAIENLEWALFMDWDVNLPDPNTSFGGGDSTLNTYWAYDSLEEGMVVYTTLVPSSPGKFAPTFSMWEQWYYLYDFVPGGPYDSLKTMMDLGYWFLPPYAAPGTDYAYLMSSENFSLNPGEKTLQEYIIWFDTQIPSTDFARFRHKLYDMLRLSGYYRGDVGDFGTGAGSPGKLDISDIVYLINFVLKSDIAPTPFIDQGDVDCNGETGLTDIVYLVGYILKSSGIAPVDKNRFFPPEYKTLFQRPSLFTDPNPQWGNLGT